MSGTMSKYVVEDEDFECFYPNENHCPIKCMSRSYAHLFIRFQDLEISMREMKNTLDTVADHIIREAKSSSSSDSGNTLEKMRAKKEKNNGSRSGSENNVEVIDVQAALERDFSELLTWKDSDDEGKPKKPKCCQVIACLKSKSPSSNDDDSSDMESSDDDEPNIADANQIVDNVGQVIDDMAKVVAEIEVTAEIAEQIADEPDMPAQNGNASQSEEEEENEEDDEEFVGDFLALYNEMNEVD